MNLEEDYPLKNINLDVEYIIKNINYMEQFFEKPIILGFCEHVKNSMKRNGVNELNVEVYRDLITHYDSIRKGKNEFKSTT